VRLVHSVATPVRLLVGGGTVAALVVGRREKEAYGEGEMFRSEGMETESPACIPGFGGNMYVLRRTPYTVSLFTCLRNKDSKQADFVEATRTLTNLILSEAMSLLPSESCTVKTPVPGECYKGLRLADGNSCLCVVSILRAADSMTQAISNLHPGMPVGKILIQRDEETALPMLATGGSANQAIRVLKKAGVAEEQIVMLSIVAAPEGLRAIAAEHPLVRVLVGEVDRGLNAKAYIVPGLGDFGDRYFGTD
jgi:uracil phosphoribosyltransferase